MKLQPVILAGGNGYRLWPLSQKNLPKQFLKYSDDLSAFQKTVINNRHLGRPLIVANAKHQKIINHQLEEIKTGAKIILEPTAKNTAPSTLVASHYAKSYGADTMVLLPSDHHIENQAKYRVSLNAALKAVKKYKFVTIGICPTFPNTNFGYIRTCGQIEDNLYLASAFIEKPDRKKAQQFINTQRYFWNSGIYFFNINHVLRLADKLAPKIAEALSPVFCDKNRLSSHDVIELAQKLYTPLPSLSFDRAISEKLSEIAVVKGEFQWHDLGSWENIWYMNKKDRNCNNIQGQVVTHRVNNSYINSDAEKTVAIDLKDIVVIFKNGQLLVANKNSADLIKQVVAEFN